MNKKISLTAILVLASLGITQQTITQQAYVEKLKEKYGITKYKVQNNTDEKIKVIINYGVFGCKNIEQDIEPGTQNPIKIPVTKMPCKLREIRIQGSSTKLNSTINPDKITMTGENLIIINKPIAYDVKIIK